MINRRQMMRGGTLGAAGMVAACDCGDYSKLNQTGPATAANTTQRTLKMVTTWPKDFPGLGTMAERVAEFITVMSGGAMTVTVYSAGNWSRHWKVLMLSPMGRQTFIMVQNITGLENPKPIHFSRQFPLA